MWTCVQNLNPFHCSHKVRSDIWEEIQVSSQTATVTLRSAITRWVSNTTASVRIVDHCLGAHCNPKCPDKLVFFDPAKEWSSEARHSVIGLSLFVTVFCVGLKLIFMIYLDFVTRQQRYYNDNSGESKRRKEVRN